MAAQLFPPERGIDSGTKAIARRGIAKARAALAATRPGDLASLKRHNTARQALTRTTTRTTQGDHP